MGRDHQDLLAKTRPPTRRRGGLPRQTPPDSRQVPSQARAPHGRVPGPSDAFLAHRHHAVILLQPARARHRTRPAARMAPRGPPARRRHTASSADPAPRRDAGVRVPEAPAPSQERNVPSPRCSLSWGHSRLFPGAPPSPGRGVSNRGRSFTPGAQPLLLGPGTPSRAQPLLRGVQLLYPAAAPLPRPQLRSPGALSPALRSHADADQPGGWRGAPVPPTVETQPWPLLSERAGFGRPALRSVHPINPGPTPCLEAAPLSGARPRRLESRRPTGRDRPPARGTPRPPGAAGQHQAPRSPCSCSCWVLPDEGEALVGLNPAGETKAPESRPQECPRSCSDAV
ncbi:PREDICTED: proline-rich protein 2-like [Chinchilla lanigera]|uniref:proline-rich protein 2-like n=1 Tax=Chinchilla lanigera TaxID=34839 RepID=UPI00038ECD2C|nr:PREDICTED: proline-rich protein 2-like [Chinchilla lanigera]